MNYTDIEEWSAENIYEWSIETFGGPGNPLTVLTRQSKELPELLEEIVNRNTDAIREELADLMVFQCQYHWMMMVEEPELMADPPEWDINRSTLIDDFIELLKAHSTMNMAMQNSEFLTAKNCSIRFMYYLQMMYIKLVGCTDKLWDAVNRKMIINAKRTWHRVEDGSHQHS